MDSSAYLMRQGWLGLGHSLHPTGRGIKKPLLISKKENVLGVGKKKHDVHADQWWARAFDSSLQDLAVGKSKDGEDIVTVTAQSWGALDLVRSGGGKWAGLYDGFVRGEGLSGTITPLSMTSTDLTESLATPNIEETHLSSGKEKQSKKRKRGDLESLEKKRRKERICDSRPGMDTVAEKTLEAASMLISDEAAKQERRRQRKEAKRLKVSVAAHELDQSTAPQPSPAKNTSADEDLAEKRRRKKEKRRKKEATLIALEEHEKLDPVGETEVTSTAEVLDATALPHDADFESAMKSKTKNKQAKKRKKETALEGKTKD